MPACLEVSSFDNIYIEIYTIGFPMEGESVLSVLKDGNNILCSFLIDSYKVEDKVPALEIAKKIQLDHIDWFFWTHPDKDHSVGIEDTLKVLDSTCQARIIIPEGLNQGLPLSLPAKSALEYIHNNYNSRREYSKLIRLSTNAFVDHLPSWRINFKEQTSEREMPCTFTILAPHSSIVDRQDFSEYPLLNEFSLVLSVSWNAYTFLYTGDIPNRGINLLNEDYLKKVLFLKIPHHGSTNSDRMVKHISFVGTGEEHAISTINKSNQIPNDGVLQSYRKMINPNNVIVVGGKEAKAEICCLKYRLVDSQCQQKNFCI